MRLTLEEMIELLDLAHGSIAAKCENTEFVFEVPESETFHQKAGVFVSLYNQDQLAGCIGFIESENYLYNSIVQAAESAAFKDPRFRNIRKKDLPTLKIEISVLSPLELVEGSKDIEIGKHGIYLKTKLQQGLILPQLAPRFHWNAETFLDQTCIKADLPVGAWKESGTNIYRFSAEIFSDDDVSSGQTN